MMGFPKPRPHALLKRERQSALKAKDTAENRKVKARSAGRCEVQTLYDRNGAFALGCSRNAVGEPHHLIYGSGRRNVGKSIFSQWKLAVCKSCHREITEHILVPVDPQADAAHVVYRRIK